MKWILVVVTAFALAACSSTTNNSLTSYPLVVARGGTGSGVVTSSGGGINCGTSCSATVKQGTQVTLTATPDQGSVFAGWGGACSGSSSPCTVTVNASTSVSATFNPAPPGTANLTVVLTGTGAGGITSSPPGLSCGKPGPSSQTCTATVAMGTPITLTASTTGSTIRFTGCDQVSNNDCLVTLSADRSVTVQYTLLGYTLTLQRPTGAVTVTSSPQGIDCEMDPTQAQNCSAFYSPGQAVTLTAVSEYGSASFTSGCDSVSGNTCTVTMNADTIVQVDAPPEPVYAVQFQGAGTGSISSNLAALNCASSSGECYSGGVNPSSFPISITAKADASSFFAGWPSNCPSVSGDTCTIGSASGGEFITFEAVFHSNLTGLQASAVGTQGVQLRWTALPADPNDNGFTVKYEVSGSGAWTTAGTAPTGAAGYTIDGLAPNTAYDIEVDAEFLDGTYSYQTIQVLTASQRSGSTLDWNAKQEAPTINNGRMGVTWDATNLYVGMTSSSGASLLRNASDQLWIAIDTNPANDTVGIGSSAGAIFPFNADYLIEVTLIDPSSGATSVQMYDAASGSFTSPASLTAVHGTMDLVQIAAADLGSPTDLRIAVASFDGMGASTDLAPTDVEATDVWGLHTSFTSSLEFTFGGGLWSTASADASMFGATSSEAPDLVTISVDHPTLVKGPIQIEGNLAPLDYNLSNSHYALHDNGHGGDTTAGDHIYSGRFNFGGATGPLYFVFTDNGIVESGFGSGKDRVRDLSGTGETFPTIGFDVLYCGNHPFTINFIVDDSSGVPTELHGNSYELGSWTSGPTYPTFSSIGGNRYWVGVNFPAGGDPMSFPIEFKAVESSNWESVSNHGIDDDIIDSVTLEWTFNAYQYF